MAAKKDTTSAGKYKAKPSIASNYTNTKRPAVTSQKSKNNAQKEKEAKIVSGIVNVASLVPAARVGSMVGKGVARAATASTAKTVRSNALKSAGTVKNAKAIARPKAPTGKTYNAAPGKTVSVKGTTGVARVKPQGAKPTARVVGRGSDLEKTNQGVRAGNTLRRSNAKEVASKAERAYLRAALKKNKTTGKVVGGTVGGAAGAAVGSKLKKK